MAAEEHVEGEENPRKNSKRKREASVLDNFGKLTNAQEKVRVEGGVDLLKYLTENENVEKAEDELKYAVARLIRGLGSANIHAKTGFFAALVGICNLKNVLIEEILEHVAKELHKGGSNSKSENADICSGQILVAGAVIRSNLYTNSEDKEKIKIIELLLNAGKERVYLNLACYKFLTDLYSKINPEEFEKLVFPLIKQELSKPWQEQDLDSLYLLLETKRHFPQAIKSKFLRNNLGTSEILCSESLPQLCAVLTTIPRVVALKHPLFDLVVEKLIGNELVVEFFDALDSTLSKSNRNKYFVATKLLTEVLKRVEDGSVIPQLLTKNYVQQTLNTYRTAVGKHKDKEFQQLTQKLFETLVVRLNRNDVKSKTKIRILRKLLFYPGTFIFEKVTKSKLVQSVAATLDADGVKKLGSIYRDVVSAVKDRVVDENTVEKWWNTDRIYASHLLVKLLGHPSMNEQKEWKSEQVAFLMEMGLLRDRGVSHELADSFKEAFYSSLDVKASKLDDLRTILAEIVRRLDESVDDLRQPLSEEARGTWRRAVDAAKRLESSAKKKNAVFHVLFAHLALQIFNNSKLASDSLEELFSCYERVKKTKKGESETNSDDPLWIEVVVDLFLNLLSHNSHLLRSVINCVFPHLCKYMTASAVHQILSVLDPKSEVNPLSQTDDESSDEGEEEANEDASSDESHASDEEEEEEEEEGDNVNDKLRTALQQALGAEAGSDAESVDLDDLDEDEGARLDEALGQAFKQFRPNLGRKKKQSKDEQTLMHFRVRVLDLVEAYLNANPSMLLTLEIMLPLLQTLEFSIREEHQKPLRDRVGACLKKVTATKKFNDCDGVTEEVLADLLRSLVEKGTKNAIVVQDMGEKIADCCVFVVNCSIISGCGGERRVEAVIAESSEAFFNKRDCLIPYVLFKNVVQMNWKGLFELIPSMIGFVFAKTVRPFRRSQALELLKLFYSNHRLFQAHEDAVASIEKETASFLDDCVGFFREFSDNPSERKVKEKFICNLFHLLNSIKTCSVGKNLSKWDVIGEVVRECRSQMALSKDTKVAFSKLCKSLNISNVVEMKRVKVREAAEDEELTRKEKKTKKKKKVLNKEQLKSKKESKQLRLQSLSEGLGKRKIKWEDVDVQKRAKMAS